MAARRPFPRRFALRSALVAAVVLGVLATALLIHLSWSSTARRNVADVAGQLNGQIVESIKHELTGILRNAEATEEAVRSIFFQGAIAPEDEGKREFIFLALLRAQPALSRIAFGWPNGNVFGAIKADEEIRMVEVTQDAAGGPGKLRVDRYLPEPGDILFLERTWSESDFSALEQSWYRQAAESDSIVWTVTPAFADGRNPAISVSGKLYLYDRYVGVIEVAIALQRLSRYLAGVTVASSGTVAIVDGGGQIIASQDPADLAAEQAGHMRFLADLTRGESPLLTAAREALAGNGVDLAGVTAPLRLPLWRQDDGNSAFVSLSPLGFRDWVVVTVIPEQDFLANIDRNTERLIYVVIGFTLLMMVSAILLADRLIGAPLNRIAGQLRHIEGFRLDRIVRVPSRLRELDNLSAALIQMAQGLTSFQRYLPTELVRTLVSRGIEARPGGEQQELTVLFADLAGFTSLSERLGPGIVPLLTGYLDATSRAIAGQDGTIDKFIGDAVMAFWGAPLPNERHAEAACRAALACRQALRELRGPDGEPLRLRIGINSGVMLVGNVGSQERLNYTVIGDAVNLASRLEPLNKLYGTDIIVGAATREAAGSALVVRELDTVAVYGKAESVAIYELLAMADAAGGDRPAWVAAYETGLAAYRQRRWDDAIAAFGDADRLRPSGDRAACLMLELCLALRTAPPPADWAPIRVMGAK